MKSQISFAGFSFVELIAVMVIIGILAAVTVPRMGPTSTTQLQAARDELVSSCSAAQHLAMIQTDPVRLIISGNTIDIRRDVNGDGAFASNESALAAGVQYPQTVLNNQTFTSRNADFDRLGRTSATSIVVQQGSDSVTVNVSAMGFCT